MMKEDIIFVISLCLLFIAGCNLGSHLDRYHCQQEAIDAGVAKWTIDPKTGDKAFVYIKE